MILWTLGQLVWISEYLDVDIGIRSIRNYTETIRSITDPVGREIVFEYAFTSVGYPLDDPLISFYAFPNYVSAIVDPVGQRIEFSYELDDNTRGSNGWKHIDYHDGGRTSFYFSGNEHNGTGVARASGRRIDTIRCANGSTLQISYASDDPNCTQFHRVIGTEHRCADTGELLKALAFDWSTTGVTVVNDLTIPAEPRSNSYVFDYFGRLINTWNQDMVATYTQFNFAGDNPNLVSVQSAAQPMIANLARNHSFEFESDDWVMHSTNPIPGAIEIVNEAAFSGTHALLVANPGVAVSTAAV